LKGKEWKVTWFYFVLMDAMQIQKCITLDGSKDDFIDDMHILSMKLALVGSMI
jgi:hypothetical protein